VQAFLGSMTSLTTTTPKDCAGITPQLKYSFSSNSQHLERFHYNPLVVSV